jgi:DHA1 family bicyclomycin/chloramphenicol resistance-like MFS transporter
VKTAAAQREPGPRWAFIALLGATSGLSAFGMSSVVPILPVMGQSLQVDYASLQFVVSAYLLGLGVFQPVQGVLCDRYGRRPVLLGGFAVFLAASLLASFAESLPALVLARFLQSMGVSVATVVSRAIVRDSYEPEPAAVALSFISAVMGVAPVIAPLAGGAAAEVFGWRSVFWLHAGMAAALLVLLGLQLKETRPQRVQPLSVGELLRGFRLLARERRFMGHALVYSFVSGASFMFITVGADLFNRLFGMSAARFGVMWAFLAAAYVSGAVSAGALSRRHGSSRIMHIGLRLKLVAATLFVIAAFAAQPHFALFTGALVLLVYTNGLVSPLALAGAVGPHPEMAGVAAGFSSSIAMLVSMFSAMATGIAYDGGAERCAILMALACVLAWVSLRAAESGSTPKA